MPGSERAPAPESRRVLEAPAGGDKKRRAGRGIIRKAELPSGRRAARRQVILGDPEPRAGEEDREGGPGEPAVIAVTAGDAGGGTETGRGGNTDTRRRLSAQPGADPVTIAAYTN